ncbi:MAG: ATP-binding protein [Proteobacteria bacterium]|nr:ATP-binding protein [Pseudomonadota bacterium]
MKKPSWFKIVSYVLLCLLALLGNVVSLPFFLGVDFLFGSIMVFLILGYFGLSAAIPASLIASSYTILLWNHPYAIIIFCAEVLFVGFLRRKKQRSIVFLDVLFWIVAGLPLVYIFYSVVMDLPRDSVFLIMLKQGVNGIFNAFIAFSIITFAPLVIKFEKRTHRTVSFHDLFFLLIMISLSVPALVIINFVGRSEFKTKTENVVAELDAVGFEIEERINYWLGNQAHVVRQTAKIVKDSGIRTSPESQRILEMVLSLNPDFHHMCIADKNGITTAFYPSGNKKEESTKGPDFVDRTCYEMLQEGASFLTSGSSQGRGKVFAPIVTISAPVDEKGQFNGFVLAAVKTNHIHEIIVRENIKKRALITVVDDRKRVIISTVSGRNVADLYDYKKEWDISKLRNGIWQGFRKEDRAQPQLKMLNNSIFFKTLSVPINNRWKVILEKPMHPHIKQLNRFYSYSMLFVFVFSVISVLLSSFVSKVIVRSILRLQETSKNLPARIEKGESITWFQSLIYEINELIDNFRNAANKLTSMLDALRENKRLLEQRVEERTHDLTAANDNLSQSIERTKTIINTVQDGIISIDCNGIITLFNASAEGIFQYSAEEVLGKNVKMLMPYSYAKQHDGYIKNYLETNQARVIGIGREVEGRRKDGSQFPMRLAVGEMRLEGKRLFVGVVSDITIQKEIESNLIESKEKSEEANRLKSEFLNTMSHELRTPLTVILGNAEELIDENELPDPEEVADIALDIANAGKHLLQLINDLLDISKIEAGRMELKKDFVDSGELIEDAVNTMRKLADDKNINLVVEGTKAALFIDAFRMKQVILNLLSNAIKFTDEGEVKVLTAITDETFVIKVRDTGIGMDTKSLAFIFDPFRQVDGSAKRKIGGTGLGLAITKKLVHLHGGTIQVHSEPGKGSEFVVLIPNNDDY